MRLSVLLQSAASNDSSIISICFHESKFHRLKNAPNMLHYAGIALQPIMLFIMLTQAYLSVTIFGVMCVVCIILLSILCGSCKYIVVFIVRTALCVSMMCNMLCE